MKNKRIAVALFAALLSFPLYAQESVTNAFNDLKRTGAVNEKYSVMREKASSEQLELLLQQLPKSGFFCFTEDRLHDIRMRNDIPVRWIKRLASDRNRFVGKAQPGEFYTWQIGLFAAQHPLENITLKFSDLKNEAGEKIKSAASTCVNIDGVDTEGQSFKKLINVPKGEVQALWVGTSVPAQAKGTYKGEVAVCVDGKVKERVAVSLTVEGAVIANNGDNEGWRKSRLHWLNSTIGNGDQPTAPYTALEREGQTLQWLGGGIQLSATGLPAEITTCYDANNALSDAKNPVLSKDIRLVIETAEGIETLKAEKLRILNETSTEIAWQVKQKNKRFEVICSGALGFDGISDMKIKVSAKKNVAVKDIRLEVPYTAYASRYMMGLGHRGGFRPDTLIAWKWDVRRHQDKIWMGNVNAGMNLRFMDDNFVRPLVNIYYDLGKINLPKSWGNAGKGGIDIHPTDAGTTQLVAYSGERAMEKGESLHYNFSMQITPVKPINLKRRATSRFYHSNSDVSADYIPEALKYGANAINIHHKKDVYPFINYPYYDEAVPDLKQFVDKAHDKDLKVRLYYTTRELTVKVPEIWALRSLGSEVIHDGPGKDARTLIHRNGPNPWLVENLGDHFIPAWYNAFKQGKYAGDLDISVITTPDSRWNNYYLSGLDWMVKRLGIDGIYIDDSALDRKTLQRARRILDADGKERLIDIHSWNHMNQWAGFANSLHLYLELLPYVDLTWIGEGFSTHASPDFWLVEVSGIPFGLMSEMLNANNTYRGMVFGMLPRLPWSGNPVPMWHLWDNFGIQDAEMRGYWDTNNPVKSNNPDVVVTTYVKGDKALVAVANWTKVSQQVQLSLDEKALGFKPSKISLPEVENNIQKAETWERLGAGILPGMGGWLILLEK